MDDERSDAEPQAETKGAPRWVKTAWIVGAIIAVLVLVMLLTGGHGPSRHQAPTSEPSQPTTTINP